MTLTQKIFEYSPDSSEIIKTNEIPILIQSIPDLKLNAHHKLILQKFSESYPDYPIKKTQLIDVLNELLGINIEDFYRLSKGSMSFVEETERIAEDIKAQIARSEENKDTATTTDKLNAQNGTSSLLMYLNTFLSLLIVFTLLALNLRPLIRSLLSNFFFTETNADQLYWWQENPNIERIIWTLRDYSVE